MKSKLKQGYLSLAKEQKKTFNDILKPLAFERLLARVGVSHHRSKLIFKGGLCLRQFVDSGRETVDIDFLIKKVDSEQGLVQSIFEEVLAVELEDAFKFTLIDCKKLEIEHKRYPGYRINMQVNLGKTRDRLQVDLGVGDIVDEFEMDLGVLQYKGEPLISLGSVSVLAYPPEFIFSEKLQAIIELGGLNSRMKDYFDCHVLISKNILDESKVTSAIKKTFENRNTDFHKVESAPAEMIGLWASFQRKVPTAPNDISEIVEGINAYLIKIKTIKKER